MAGGRRCTGSEGGLSSQHPVQLPCRVSGLVQCLVSAVRKTLLVFLFSSLLRPLRGRSRIHDLDTSSGNRQTHFNERRVDLVIGWHPSRTRTRDQ